MRIAVVGAGIVGVTTALTLTEGGHEVHVFDSSSGVGTGASFSPGAWMATHWLAGWGPFGWGPAPRSAYDAAWSGFREGLRQPASAAWLWHHWRAARLSHQTAARAALQQLAARSHQAFTHWRDTHGTEFESTRATLLLVPTRRDLAWVRPAAERLASAGIEHHRLDVEQTLALEPSLSTSARLSGAIQFPSEIGANVRQVAHLLRAQAQVGGAQFHFDAIVDRVVPSNTRQQLALKDGRSVDGFDRVVLCTGGVTRRECQEAVEGLTLRTFHGHSITAPLAVREAMPDIGPRHLVVDLTRGVQMCRLGDRVRIAAEPRMSRRSDTIDRTEWDRLYRVLEDWYPGAARTARAQEWRGQVSFAPDGLPLIGPSAQAGVWLNLAHGSYGWTLAFGAAELLARALLNEAEPAASAFLPQRLR